MQTKKRNNLKILHQRTFFMKQLLFIILFFTTIAHTMNTKNNYAFSIVHNNTTIILKKQPITDAHTNIIVIGQNQQTWLKTGQFNNDLTMGKITLQEKNNRWAHHIYHKNMNEDSDSENDTYKPFILKNDPTAPLHDLFFIETTEVEPIIFKITEPCIAISPCNAEASNIIENFIHYNFVHYNNEQDINKQTYQKKYEDNEALTKASEKLTICYKNALSLGLIKLYNIDKRSIALDALSTKVGFPREKAAPIAIDAIIDFINNFPDAYNRIELFIKKRSEFETYKKLLQKTLSNDNTLDDLTPQDIMLSNLLSCIFNLQLSFDNTYDDLKQYFYQYIFNNECCNNNESHNLSDEQLYQIFLDTSETEIMEQLHQIFAEDEEIETIGHSIYISFDESK